MGMGVPEEKVVRIGELSARSGLSRDTLRYYERFGLLPKPLRASGGFRLYPLATLDHLRFIALVGDERTVAPSARSRCFCCHLRGVLAVGRQLSAHLTSRSRNQ